jgi:hypothetical protein
MEMISDKELLQLAAKAAGIELLMWMEGSQTYGCRTATLPQYVEGVGQHNFWNPLTDDGDALRLAVKLNLHIQIDFDAADVNQLVYVYGNWRGQGIDEPPGADPYAATRRAIVRAAAEIGKGMK